MAQWVRAPAAKPEDLSSILETEERERTLSQRLSSGCHTLVMADVNPPPHTQIDDIHFDKKGLSHLFSGHF